MSKIKKECVLNIMGMTAGYLVYGLNKPWEFGMSEEIALGLSLPVLLGGSIACYLTSRDFYKLRKTKPYDENNVL